MRNNSALKSSVFSVSQEDIDSVLVKGSGFEQGKYRIYHQFQKREDSKSNIAFLKNEYGTGGGTHVYPDGTRGGADHTSKGIAIEKQGSYTKPDVLLSWFKVEKRLRELIKNDRYLSPKEKDHYADYLESVSAPQYEIETQRKLTRQRFISSKSELPPADKRDSLAQRLSDFIRDLDGYEKGLLSDVGRTDLADVTDTQMEQHLSDPATVQQLIDFLALLQRKTTAVYSRSNAWRFGQELIELYPLVYLYHEGDVVYIGADKYEVTDISENTVTLRNPEFPLFGKELDRADFEEKLRENPVNDHLKVVVTEKQKTELSAEKKPDSLTFSIGFSEHPTFYSKGEDGEFKDRYTNLSFALGNRLLGVLDEKQHREREDENNHVGWYHKTDFKISATIDGEEFNYEGRFDIGDGEGDLIAHIKNFYDYALSPKGEQLYGDEQEELRRGRDEFVPFLMQHTGLTTEDEKLLAEIMATEKTWFQPAKEKKIPVWERETEILYATLSQMKIEDIKLSYDENRLVAQDADNEWNGAEFYHFLIDEAMSFDDNGELYGMEMDADIFADFIELTSHNSVPITGNQTLQGDSQTQITDDLIGKEITIDNRQYLIESVGEISGDVSMRDTTFQSNAGFPIKRVEKIGYVHRRLEQEELQPEKEKSTAPEVPTYSNDRRNFHITDDALVAVQRRNLRQTWRRFICSMTLKLKTALPHLKNRKSYPVMLAGVVCRRHLINTVQHGQMSTRS